MAGFTTNSAEDILSKIRGIFEGIPKETLAADYNEWITRLEWIIEQNGERSHAY
jgi:hypothetical protein